MPAASVLAVWAVLMQKNATIRPGVAVSEVFCRGYLPDVDRNPGEIVAHPAHTAVQSLPDRGRGTPVVSCAERFRAAGRSRFSGPQRRTETAQGTGPEDRVGDHWIAGAGIFGGRPARQGYTARRRNHLSGDVFNKRSDPVRQRGFVRSHTDAGSAHQYEPGPGSRENGNIGSPGTGSLARGVL
jgi:hypothetical protein